MKSILSGGMEGNYLSRRTLLAKVLTHAPAAFHFTSLPLATLLGPTTPPGFTAHPPPIIRAWFLCHPPPIIRKSTPHSQKDPTAREWWVHRYDGTICSHLWFHRMSLSLQVFGLVLALGAGLPLGKEGPFVHLSCCLVDGLLRLPFFRAIRRKF